MLGNLTVTSLKSLCWEEIMKVLGSKANLIGHLLPHWEHKCTDNIHINRAM